MTVTQSRAFIHWPTLCLAAVLVSACGGNGNSGTNGSDGDLPSSSSDLKEPAGFYKKDGYENLAPLEVSIRTATADGPCDEEDITGCTLDTINSDNDGSDNFEPEINVHFLATDYPQDSLEANAEFKQRGDTSRAAAQKSYSVKLYKDAAQWRNERRLQLNKHPFDEERIRNKLSFDLMSNIDNINSLRSQFVHLFVEDKGQSQDYGLYTHVEYVGKEYLANRGYPEDSPIYKTVNFTFNRLADRLQVNADGSPVDEALFERNLEIKSGDNHRVLIEMLDALNDPVANKKAVVDTYFNENNIITWLAVNILLGNNDTVFENYYLYNPLGTKKFYFLPWDYDGAFKTENNPDEYSGQDAIRRRMEYGVSKWWDSVLIRTWLQQTGSYEKLTSRVKELASGRLSTGTVNSLVESYRPLIQPILMSEPDLQYMEGTDAENKLVEWTTQTGTMASRVQTNRNNFVNDPGWPMAFNLLSATPGAGVLDFSWAPSFDFQGDAITYTLDVSNDPAFGSSVITVDNIPNNPGTGTVTATVDSGTLSTGTWYWRVIARDNANPQENWRPAYSRITVNGEYYYGIGTFDMP